MPEADWLDVLNPVAEATAAPKQLAPRPSQLKGAVLGIVDNGKPGAALLLKELERLLVDRGAHPRVLWREKIATYPLPAAELAELARECDVVVAGVGD
ncbi:MAG: hypothetical protein HY329_08445 [Chloroflexi bacterium]|nr:hypothetical protein [Chloroflexota bacterium]